MRQSLQRHYRRGLVGAAVLGKLVVQRGKLLSLDRLNGTTERDGFAGDPRIRMSLRIGLWDGNRLSFFLADKVSFDVDA